MDIRAETKKELVRTGQTTFELVAPHLFYLKSNTAQAYTLQKKERSAYAEGFHKEIIGLMHDNVPRLLRSSLQLVDLGPGEYPDKTAPLMTAAVHLGVPIVYVPVDVSNHYLQKASEAVNILAPSATIFPLQMKFEDLDSSHLSDLGLDFPLIFFGPTYMNFPSAASAALLTKMISDKGQAMMASELLTADNNSEAIRARYDSAEAITFGFAPLENLGCAVANYKGEILFNDAKNRIEAHYLCLANDQEFKEGDRVTTAVSYRVTLENFESDLAKIFGHVQIFISPSGHTALALCGL